MWLDRDPCGRITAETCNGRTVSSSYDVAGRRRRRVTPFGAVADWDYDEAGQPVRLTAGEHEIRFGYDAAGREVRRELPGGLVLTQAWDQRGRLTLQALSGADGLAGVAEAAGLAARGWLARCCSGGRMATTATGWSPGSRICSAGPGPSGWTGVGG